MKRNKFNLSHYKIGSADMGRLYPISCFEVLPGDTIQMNSSVFLRFAPMLSPVLHPVRVALYTFYVPLRLLWTNFESFITGGVNGLDSNVPPTVAYSNGVTRGSLLDYLGVPVGYTGPLSYFPIRAYALIYNEYFRDQDLISEQSFGTGNATIVTSNNPPDVFTVAWEKDYFTTARPWPQKGAQVTVPIEGASGSGSQDLNVVPSGDGTIMVKGTFSPVDESDPITGTYNLYQTDGASSVPNVRTRMLGVSDNLQWPDNTNLKVTMPSASSLFPSGIGSVRLDALREAFALQRFEEHRSMYGSRYTEYLRFLGVKSSDARLQRPEYLGGGKTTMQFSEVLQTAVDGDNPVGTLRGHGIGAARSRTFRRFIEEHGLVMTLMTIRPITIYQNGLNKMWSRQYKEDYWQKELQHIGQQEVLSKELYATGDNADNDVFGYQNRYDEYRSVPSTVAGEMRDLLDYWHLSRNFGNRPVLNASFIQGLPTKRVFAEQTQNEIYFMAQHHCVARRLLAKQGNPIL